MSSANPRSPRRPWQIAMAHDDKSRFRVGTLPHRHPPSIFIRISPYEPERGGFNGFRDQPETRVASRARVRGREGTLPFSAAKPGPVVLAALFSPSSI